MSSSKNITRLKCRVTTGDSRRQIPVRVSIIDHEGNYYAPENSLFYGYSMPGNWPSDWGVKGDGKYFYANGEFELELPCREYTVKIFRGVEYEPFERCFMLSPDGTDLDVSLKRIADMPSAGWYCGDNHTHLSHPPLHYNVTDQDGVFIAAAEGLNHICYLKNKTEYEPYEQANAEWQVQAHFSYELGHHPVLNILASPSEELTYSIHQGGEWFSLCDWVHERNGTIILGHPLFANHLYPGLLADDLQPARMTHYELPVNVALGKVDTFELQNNRQSIIETWLQVWYRLLNCGFHIPPSAGTDACTSVRTTLPPGVYRSYVHCGSSDFTAYLDGLKQGRSFITDGPLVFLKVNGREPGDTIELESGENVSVSVKVSSIFSVPGVELIKNGQVVKQWDMDGALEFSADCELEVTGSCWLALRIFQKREKRVEQQINELFAHTGPVQVICGGKEIKSSTDAMYFLEWINFLEQFRLDGDIHDEPTQQIIDQARWKYFRQLNEADQDRYRHLPQNSIEEFSVCKAEQIDDEVTLEMPVDCKKNIVVELKTIKVDAGNYYRISANIISARGKSAAEEGGYTVAKIAVFDLTGKYLGAAEDSSKKGGSISVLIYADGNTDHLQLAYSLESPGTVKYEDVVISKVTGPFYNIC